MLDTYFIYFGTHIIWVLDLINSGCSGIIVRCYIVKGAMSLCTAEYITGRSENGTYCGCKSFFAFIDDGKIYFIICKEPLWVRGITSRD